MDILLMILKLHCQTCRGLWKFFVCLGFCCSLLVFFSRNLYLKSLINYNKILGFCRNFVSICIEGNITHLYCINIAAVLRCWNNFIYEMIIFWRNFPSICISFLTLQNPLTRPDIVTTLSVRSCFWPRVKWP